MTTPLTGPVNAEPVVITELARAVIVALVSLGWITVDNNTMNVVATVVGLVLSWLLALIARSKVTPVNRENP